MDFSHVEAYLTVFSIRRTRATPFGSLALQSKRMFYLINGKTLPLNG
jgi:hypothetical protein